LSFAESNSISFQILSKDSDSKERVEKVQQFCYTVGEITRTFHESSSK